MSEFKPGDRVRCVDAPPMYFVKAGEEYTVERVTPDYIYLEGLETGDDGYPAGYWPSRFQLVEEEE